MVQRGPRWAYGQGVRFERFWRRVQSHVVLPLVTPDSLLDNAWTDAVVSEQVSNFYQLRLTDPSDSTAFDPVGEQHGLAQGLQRGLPSPVSDGSAVSPRGEGYVQVPASAAGLSADRFTVGLWVQPDAADVASASLIDAVAGGGFRLTVTGGALQLDLSDGTTEVSVTSGPVLTADEWAFVAASWDGGNMRLFVDGRPVEWGRADEAAYTVRSGGPVKVGDGLAGALDEVVLFDDAVPAGLLSQVYLAGTGVRVREAPDLTATPDMEVKPQGYDSVYYRMAGSGSWIGPVSSQAAADQAGAGATVRFEPGTYYGFSINPPTDQRWFAAEGDVVVLDGTRALTDPVEVSTGVWQYTLNEDLPYTFQVDYDKGEWEPGSQLSAGNRYDVWDGDTLLDHSTANTDGTYEIDHTASPDTITIYDSSGEPAAPRLSRPRWAFYADQGPVTVDNITVRRYAVIAQDGAIQGGFGGQGKITVRHCRVTENHGGGIKAGAGSVLLRCDISYNGQIGFGSDGQFGRGVQVLDCHIHHNKTLGYKSGWEAGAQKIVQSYAPLVENCWFEANNGYGCWFDIDNAWATVRSCLVEDTELEAVFFEIGFGGEVSDSVMRNNGSGSAGDGGNGVFVSTNADAFVHHNVIYGNRGAIIPIHGVRGTSELPERDGQTRGAWGLFVWNNAIAQTDGGLQSGPRLYDGLTMPAEQAFVDTMRWEDNDWFVANDAAGNFFVIDGMNTFTDWQTNYGWDLNGSITEGTGADINEDDYIRRPFVELTYGPY